MVTACGGSGIGKASRWHASDAAAMGRGNGRNTGNEQGRDDRSLALPSAKSGQGTKRGGLPGRPVRVTRDVLTDGGGAQGKTVNGLAAVRRIIRKRMRHPAPRGAGWCTG